LILPKVSFIADDFFVVIADFLSIPTNFLFASAVANISAKLGFVLPQFLEVAP
jgi:hypothetical protein